MGYRRTKVLKLFLEPCLLVHPLLLLDMAFPFGAERSVRLKPRPKLIPRLILRLGTMDIMDTVLDTMVDTMGILMDMDTMDILTDMGMDIMVDKHNNQNAKKGLERTPELSSSNFNQKNKLHQIICSRSKNVKSTRQNFTMLVHISPLLFSPFAKTTLWIRFWSIENKSFTIFSKKHN